MEIRAAEISAILKNEIANFGTEADVAEVGQVISVGDGVARVFGLDKSRPVKWSSSPTVHGHGAEPRNRQCRRRYLRR